MIMKAAKERSLKPLRDAVALTVESIFWMSGHEEVSLFGVAEHVRILKEQIEEKAKVKLSPEEGHHVVLDGPVVGKTLLDVHGGSRRTHCM